MSPSVRFTLGGRVIGAVDPGRGQTLLVARTEGILLDPVYSGKAMAGLIRLAREGSFPAGGDVLFWHTGGSVGLFVYDDVFNLAAVKAPA